MRTAVCSGGSNPRNTNRWTQITAQWLTNKLDWKKNSDDNYALFYLKSVGKGAFFLFREGVT